MRPARSWWCRWEPPVLRSLVEQADAQAAIGEHERGRGKRRDVGDVPRAGPSASSWPATSGRTTSMTWVIGRTQTSGSMKSGKRSTPKNTPENTNIGVTQKVKK